MSNATTNPFANLVTVDQEQDGTELSHLDGDQNMTAYLRARNQQLTRSLTRTEEALERSRRNSQTLKMTSGVLFLLTAASARWLIAESVVEDADSGRLSRVCPSSRAVLIPTMSCDAPIPTSGSFVGLQSESEDNDLQDTITGSEVRGEVSETASESTFLTLYRRDGSSIRITVPTGTGGAGEAAATSSA